MAKFKCHSCGEEIELHDVKAGICQMCGEDAMPPAEPWERVVISMFGILILSVFAFIGWAIFKNDGDTTQVAIKKTFPANYASCELKDYEIKYGMNSDDVYVCNVYMYFEEYIKTNNPNVASFVSWVSANKKEKSIIIRFKDSYDALDDHSKNEVKNSVVDLWRQSDVGQKSGYTLRL